MKKVISILISVVMLFNTTLAYTLKLTIAGVEMTTTWEEGDEVTIESKMEKIVGWKVKSGDIELVNNKFTMPDEDVEIEALMKYQLTVENMYVTTKEEKTQDQSVTITATSNEDNVFARWVAEGITLSESDKTSPTLTFNMPGNDVTLTAKYITTGSYVTYASNKEPVTILGTASGARVSDMEEGRTYETSTEVDSEGATLVNQTYTPSNTTSWRVLKINAGQLDIVPVGGSVGELTLRGKAGFANSIGILNEISSRYANETYATGAVSLGYSLGSTAYIDQGIINIDSLKGRGNDFDALMEAVYDDDYNTLSEKANQLSPFWDMGYVDLAWDEEFAMILDEVIGENMWVASRETYFIEAEPIFLCDFYLSMLDKLLRLVESSSDLQEESYGVTHGVCPVVSLKSGIKITGGEGTVDSPFTISID